MTKKLLYLTALAAAASLSSYAAVPDGWSIEPADGSTVTEIKEFVVKKDNGRFDPYVNRKVKINGVDYTVTQKISGTTDDINTISLSEAITADGTYNVVIPKGTFDYNYNWMLEEGDPNPEISFTLTIGGGDPGPGPDDPKEFTPIDNPYYTITPEQGKVGMIKSFTVEYQRSGLLPEGYGSNKPTLVNEESGETVASFSVMEGGGMRDVILSLDEAYTEPGQYLVKIPDAAISDYMDEDWPAAQFRYVIDASITPEVPQETVTADPATGSTVGSLSSVKLYFPDMSEIYASGPNKDKVTVKRDGELTDTKVSFNYDPSTMLDCEIGMVFTPALTEAGQYEIYVPDNALSLGASTFDTRYNYEFTLNYTVKGLPADGAEIFVAPLKYKVISAADKTLSVTWTDNEDDYSGVKEIPAQVEYEGETYTVVEVGKLAFSQVKGISDMKIPETVKTIGDAAFWESSLSSIELPATLEKIDESAFDATSLKSFTVPAGVTSLGADVLYGCTALETINLNDKITALPSNMAAGCTMLKSIVIPECVTEIGEFAFSECAVLSDVTLPSALKTVGRFAFAYTPDLKKLILPESVTSMGHGVFYQSGLEEAALPEAITVIPDGTFQCCANLKEFTVGDNVTDIEQEAFYWCFGLEKISFGSSLNVIGKDAFLKDEAIKEVYSYNPVPPTGAVFAESVYQNAILYVHSSVLDAYKAAEGWKEFAHIINYDDAVDEVAAESFSVKAVAGNLNIVSADEVTVYDAAGRVAYKGGSASVGLPSGIYMVVSGSRTVKVHL